MGLFGVCSFHCLLSLPVSEGSISAGQPVHPPESGGKIPRMNSVMVVMEVGAAITRNPIPRADGEVVPRVALDGLEAAQGKVDVESEEVRPNEQRRDDGRETEA